MLDRLFGPHRSVERQVAIVLSGILIVLGLVIIPWLGVRSGLLVVVVGLLGGIVLARMAENRNAARASAELLGGVASAEVDDEGLRRMVDRARTASPAQVPVRDLGDEDRGELPFTPEQPEGRRRRPAS